MPTRNKSYMWARKFIHELLVAGPFLLLAVIAINARTRFDPWVPPANSPEVESRLDVFVEPMREIRRLGWHADRLDAKLARKAAAVWLEADAKGQIRDLPPATLDETMRDGVKGQIVTTRNAIAQRLLELAESAQESGESLQSADDALLAYRVAGTMQYSDFTTVYDTIRAQVRAMKMLHACAERLDSARRRAIVAAVEEKRDATADLNKILRHMRRLYDEHALRSGVHRLSIEDTQQFATFGQTIQRECDAQNLQVVRKLIVASHGEMPRILSVAKLAWQSVARRREAAKELVAAIRDVRTVASAP
ncbi:MAG TPA: hypothetical protein PLL78_00445 [Fimbriimonadaceae bacterium]|nr:hypothetical protein [Fimbriimonadaceae bacterium]HRJ95130.1 hypothetical protein [Fimbriimonadaceae bacterium]